MITESDLNSAIKECEGQRSPNANTALKLAAFYTIRNELYPSTREDPPPIASGYSYAPPSEPEQSTIVYDSGTEFGDAINGREPYPVWAIIDDLMSVLRSAQPRVYRRIIDKIEEL